MAITLKKIQLKMFFCKSLAALLDFDFVKHPVYPYELKEDLIVRLELNYSEKVIFCS